MSEIKHTPLPWKFAPWHIEEDAASVRAPEGWAICFTSSDANAEFIVKACNSYYENLAEIARLRGALADMLPPDLPWKRDVDGVLIHHKVAAVNAARAALKEPTP